MLEDRILVADDEQSMREFLDIMLKKEGYKVSLAANGEEVLKLIDKDLFDLILLDIRMPRLDGIGVLKKVKTSSPETIVIMITAYASADTAIKAMKEGAYDYITKPFKVDEIKLIIKNALEKKNLQKENLLLKQVVLDRYRFGSIIGQSSKMLALMISWRKSLPPRRISSSLEKAGLERNSQPRRSITTVQEKISRLLP
jgi:two-component system response regulator PilR (NtrC family)